jgi:hypothetical protein
MLQDTWPRCGSHACQGTQVSLIDWTAAMTPCTYHLHVQQAKNVNSAFVVLPSVGVVTLLILMFQPSLLRTHVSDKVCQHASLEKYEACQNGCVIKGET